MDHCTLPVSANGNIDDKMLISISTSTSNPSVFPTPSTSPTPSPVTRPSKRAAVKNLLRKFRQAKFLKLKSGLVKEIILSLLVMAYLLILLLLSLPSVSRKVKEVKVKVRSAVRLVTSHSSGALSMMTGGASRSTGSLPSRCSQYRLIV